MAAMEKPLKLLNSLNALAKASAIFLAASLPPSWKTFKSAPAEKNFSPFPVTIKV
jgi:hypothetical protein